MICPFCGSGITALDTCVEWRAATVDQVDGRSPLATLIDHFCAACAKHFCVFEDDCEYGCDGVTVDESCTECSPERWEGK
jgi:hypothetical protein